MNHSSSTPDDSNPAVPTASQSPWQNWLDKNPWVPFVLPLAVFMLVGQLEPSAERPLELMGVSIPYRAYPLVYIIKIVLTMGAIGAVWPIYRRFAWHVSPLAPLVGVVGVVVWVGLCRLGLESMLLTPLGLGEWVEPSRSAFHPMAHWPDSTATAYGFLAIRFWGLAVVVPIIEEFFLRAFLMRFFVAPDWWKVPFGTLTPTAIAVGTLVPVLMHPLNEALAVICWFTLVTWLMFKTKSIWDCIIAHAVTNFLLGVYVVQTGEWHLW